MRFALLAVFVSALSANAADNPTADEKAAIDAIAKSGGKGDIDSKLFFEARVTAKFDAVTDGVLIGLKKYPQIGAIDAFDVTRCTEKGFAALKELPNLRKLVIGKAGLTQGEANAIGEYKELRHLALVSCGVTDTELAAMKKLTLLEHLALSDNPKITDKGMATVKGFERLQVLYLNKVPISDKGLQELKALDGLRTLSVKGSNVTSDAAEKFPDDMPNLRKVAW
jgi:Leucine-rich repeat (LRR) protein